MEPKLLIANRGEIALRVIRSAVKLGIPTVAIFTLADAASPHVSQAAEAYCIGDGTDPRGYLDIDAIVAIAKKSNATMVAPGYGFLSENAAFATACEDNGLVFLGPTPYQIKSMGLKHEARAVALKAGVPVVPGSDGVVSDLEEAVRLAKTIGYPVMVKASGGGGGMGMQVCRDEAALEANFQATRDKGAALFKESAVFLEKFITRARHIEVQIFGNGTGHVIHAGERECSVQRRHQKVIEESPCVLFSTEAGKGVRERMCQAAVRLGQLMQYRSAGTVEFVLDIDSPDLEFYFLELNARIQVEHGITEAVHPGLDLVELMIRQGMSPAGSLDVSALDQAALLNFHGHAIEARVYCENPKAGFKPSPGQLHHVEWADVGPGGRIDTWVETGTTVTPHYDPMIAKVIVHGETREVATARMTAVLGESKIVGPTNNMDYCRTILATEAFRTGTVHTTFLDTFEYSPSAIEVLAPGLATTVQDLPGRNVGLGIPRGGPADMLSFQAANVLVGNTRSTEALEITMIGPKLLFHTDAVIAVTGATMKMTLDGNEVSQWTTLGVKKDQVLHIGTALGHGLRSYLAVKGGFPNVATFMGSKSTFEAAKLGGHQGRPLLAGDLLEISSNEEGPIFSAPSAAVPAFSSAWEIEVCVGAQWDPAFIAPEGMSTLLDTEWQVTPASNRSGLRLEGPRIQWARSDGGEGGSHPSNVVDQGYPFGALNLNGDTPVLFGVDAPDMGGFACVLTVATGSHWKLGQIRPGDTVRFVCISIETASELEDAHEQWLSSIRSSASIRPSSTTSYENTPASTSALHRSPGSLERTFRQAGDRFVLYEVGPMELDIQNRVQVELWERAMREANISGVINFNTCIRSCLVQFDPRVISMTALLKIMIETDAGLSGAEDVQLYIHVIRLPVVVDDKWCQEAVDYYMRTSRDEAVYLPNTTHYVARNNGGDQQIVFDALTKTPWLVLARGFFVMLPFIVLDPRRRLLAQKYNPSRTRTPEGAIGLAGVVGSIYPIASAGGYQLLGRTISTWQAWAENHSIVDNFDQIEFFPVSEDDFVKTERAYKAGSWQPERRKATFKMRDYLQMLEDTRGETVAFKRQQLEASSVIGKEEEALFAKFNAAKGTAGKRTIDTTSSTDGLSISSPLSASVYKILVRPGDVIPTDDTAVIELEAMKTSIMVPAGEGMGGNSVLSIAVQEGDTVDSGTVLVYIG